MPNKQQRFIEIARIKLTMGFSSKKSLFWQRYADKVGMAGSIFAALCCLGFPALLSILSAIGLGFLINDAILLPLLAISLVVTLFGVYTGMRHHGQPWAFILGIVSALITFVFIFISTVVAYLGLAGLIVAGVLNIWLRSRQLQKI
ncbi:MAG: hypothetical protein BRC46_02210 [Cyanobacteria bacterium QS_6_48_18]|nr:MAG: hypothetical protein BRC46_02210 [Cyanobacteria bacterium QS_6_48_18]